MSDDVVFQEVLSEDGLIPFAQKLAAFLQTQKNFVLWLEGPMGAGKSTLTRHVMWALGLDTRIPVVSPTYTIMNEYQIQGRWYAHLDFYRAERSFSMDELGLEGHHEYSGVFVEWPEAPPELERLTPTLRMVISPIHEGAAREYRLLRPLPTE